MEGCSFVECEGAKLAKGEAYGTWGLRLPGHNKFVHRAAERTSLQLSAPTMFQLGIQMDPGPLEERVERTWDCVGAPNP